MCKSILEENGIEIEANIKINKLAKQAVQNIAHTYPEWQAQETKESFIKLINSFSQTLDNAMSAIGTLRNEYCPLAHGRSSNHTPLHLIYAEFVAQQTDAILLFFLKLIEHKNLLMPPAISYLENPELNEYIDDQHDSLDIFEDTYLASEILFQMNQRKYQIALKEYKESLEEIEGQENDQ